MPPSATWGSRSTLTGNVTLTGNNSLFTTDNTSSGVIFAGVIGGSGTLSPSGSSGFIDLAGNNTYSGGTIIGTGSTVLVGNPRARIHDAASPFGTGTVTALRRHDHSRQPPRLA